MVRAVARNSQTSQHAGLYDRRFWLAFANNACLMTAFSLLYRFSNYVKLLCGPEMSEEAVEWNLGLIVGVGMIGSMLTRLVHGQAIVRLGARQVWCWSAMGFAAASLAHLLVENVHGPGVYVAQIAFRTFLAGTFGASITYVSSRVPVERVPEAVGMLGSSGFLGMMIGTLAGDLIFWQKDATWPQVQWMFYGATGLGLVSLLFAVLATRGEVRPKRRRQPPLWWLVRRYHPGILLLVAVAVGTGTNLPNNFLVPFTESLGIQGIKTFFWVYCITAFIARYMTRQMPHKVGVRPMILLGLLSLVASMLLYLVVRSEWLLALPGAVAGIAHATLFPSVTGGGSIVFPARYRGIGVTLMLAMVDLGVLLGMPLTGRLLYTAEQTGFPRYPTMFICMAVLMVVVAGIYAWNSRGSQGIVTDNGVSKLPQRRQKKRKAAKGRGRTATATEGTLPAKG